MSLPNRLCVTCSDCIVPHPSRQTTLCRIHPDRIYCAFPPPPDRLHCALSPQTDCTVPYPSRQTALCLIPPDRLHCALSLQTDCTVPYPSRQTALCLIPHDRLHYAVFLQLIHKLLCVLLLLFSYYCGLNFRLSFQTAAPHVNDFFCFVVLKSFSSAVVLLCPICTTFN